MHGQKCCWELSLRGAAQFRQRFCQTTVGEINQKFRGARFQRGIAWLHAGSGAQTRGLGIHGCHSKNGSKKRQITERNSSDRRTRRCFLPLFPAASLCFGTLSFWAPCTSASCACRRSMSTMASIPLLPTRSFLRSIACSCHSWSVSVRSVVPPIGLAPPARLSPREHAPALATALAAPAHVTLPSQSPRANTLSRAGLSLAACFCVFPSAPPGLTPRRSPCTH